MFNARSFVRRKFGSRRLIGRGTNPIFGSKAQHHRERSLRLLQRSFEIGEALPRLSKPQRCSPTFNRQLTTLGNSRVDRACYLF